MKKIILISLLVLVSCNEEKKAGTIINTKKDYDFTKSANSIAVEDDFSDLKKLDDEACDTEEEIKEKLVKPKQEAFKLQGGDTGCDIEELNKEN